jgi:hypothetical protein
LAIEKMARRSVLKPEKMKHNYKKMTLILQAHECRKHCKTQEKKTKHTGTANVIN